MSGIYQKKHTYSILRGIAESMNPSPMGETGSRRMRGSVRFSHSGFWIVFRHFFRIRDAGAARAVHEPAVPPFQITDRNAAGLCFAFPDLLAPRKVRLSCHVRFLSFALAALHCNGASYRTPRAGEVKGENGIRNMEYGMARFFAFCIPYSVFRIPFSILRFLLPVIMYYNNGK
jgi:hypothetical protein